MSRSELRTSCSARALKLINAMRCSGLAVLVFAVYTLTAHEAGASGTLRFGVMPLDLESSSDTPLFGSRVERAVDTYNAAAAAYGMQPIDASDLGITETLYVIAPGFELGGGLYFFRMEAPIGVSPDLKSVGLAIYPVNLQAKVQRGVVLYVSAGGSASWLDRPGAGDIGGLLALRGAAGVRFASHIMFEVGYGALVVGGTINFKTLAAMTSSESAPSSPQQAVSAGAGSGLLDASIGVTF